MTIEMGESWIAGRTPSTLAEVRQTRVPAPREATVYRSAELEVTLAELERRAAMTALREARLRVERANDRLCEALERETAQRRQVGGEGGPIALRASRALS
jgi:hypothetical protein